MSVFKDPIIEKIFNNIEASASGVFTTYFYGDPVLLAKSDLPALIGVKDTTEIGDESNAEDYHRMNIVLTVVIDIRQYLEEPADYNVHVAYQKLYDVIEGRNADYTLKSTSVLDILRKNHNLNNNANIDLRSAMNIDYGFTVGKRAENALAWEANIFVPIYFTQLRD
jgi:hypothetical protein